MFSALFSTTSVSAYASAALSASGAGTYIVVRGIPLKGYERTPHIPPTPTRLPKLNELDRDAQQFLLKPGVTPQSGTTVANAKTAKTKRRHITKQT